MPRFPNIRRGHKSVTDQRKSPTEGQGFSNSFGGEYEKHLYSEITKKASGAKMKWAGPLIVRPSQPGQNGGSLFALCDGVVGQRSVWQSGEIIHPFALLHAARLAADDSRVLLIAVMGDGTTADISLREERVDAWLRGEVGK